MIIAQIKYFLKVLKSNFLINILWFTMLPLLMGGFMSFITDNSSFENVTSTPVIIEDLDNSNSSLYLNEFLKNNYSDLFNIVNNENDANLKIIIPKNYESKVLNNDIANIKIEELKSKSSFSLTLKEILDDYNASLYLNTFNNIDKNVISSFNKSSITSEYINIPEKESTYKTYSLIMISYLSMMMIAVNVQAKLTPLCIGINKKMHSLPFSKVRLFLMDLSESFFHYFIFNMIYILTYRILDINFTGNISTLVILGLCSSLLIASISGFINSFSSKIFSYIVIGILNIYQLGIVFFESFNLGFYDFLINTSPVYLIDTVYTNATNSLPFINELVIMIIVSISLIGFCIVKQKYFWRKL